MNRAMTILIHEEIGTLSTEARVIREEIRKKKQDKEITSKLWSIIHDLRDDEATSYLVPGNELVVSSRKTVDFTRLQQELLERGIDSKVLAEAVEASKVSRPVLTIKKDQKLVDRTSE